jgi:hypothetical protein
MLMTIQGMLKVDRLERIESSQAEKTYPQSVNENNIECISIWPVYVERQGV